MTISEDAASIAKQITVSLPAPFLAMVCLNVVFILGLLFFLRASAQDQHDQNIQRIVSMERVVTACTTALERSAPLVSSGH